MGVLDQLHARLFGGTPTVAGRDDPWSGPRVLDHLLGLLDPRLHTLLEVHDLDGRSEGRHRLGLFGVAGTRLHPILDVWVTASDHLWLRNAYESNGLAWRRGGWDGMYARRWSFVHTLDLRGPALVWGRRRVLFHGQDGLWSTSDQTLEGSRITRVVVTVDWGTSCLRLHGPDLDPHAHVLTQDHTTHPFYDGIDLMCDAHWLVMLGRHLAERIGADFDHLDIAA
jgi:hypothetical protein